MAPHFRYASLSGLASGSLTSSVLVTILACVACEHHEPDRSVATAAAPPPPAQTIQSAPEKPVPTATCQLPLAADPPPMPSPAASCPADPTGPMNLPHAWVSFKEAPGAPRIAVEVAETDAARERGLMYVKKLPDEQGMIFNWSEAAQRSFWMHITCIPLDMLFIAGDGTIAGILEQVPPLDESPRGVPCPVTHVLEVNAGWARAHGVRPGQRVRIES